MTLTIVYFCNFIFIFIFIFVFFFFFFFSDFNGRCFTLSATWFSDSWHCQYRTIPYSSLGSQKIPCPRALHPFLGLHLNSGKLPLSLLSSFGGTRPSVTTYCSVAGSINDADCSRRDGDDGDWSSFTLRVGNPEQTVRVLPSTAGQETWVVLPKGCQDGEPGKGKSTSQSCSDSRGGLFNLAASTSFKRIGNYSLGPFEHNLGTPNDTATYGLDTVSLGFAKATGGPSLDSQVVSTFATDTYYTGMFGLGHQGTNFTNLTNTHTGYLTTMKEKNLIPSLSWAYTAGAKYRK